MQAVRKSSLPSLLAMPLFPVMVATTLILSGCGNDGGRDGFSQEFERPEVEPPAVQDPPDEGDELHPRERDGM